MRFQSLFYYAAFPKARQADTFPSLNHTLKTTPPSAKRERERESASFLSFSSFHSNPPCHNFSFLIWSFFPFSPEHGILFIFSSFKASMARRMHSGFPLCWLCIFMTALFLSLTDASLLESTEIESPTVKASSRKNLCAAGRDYMGGRRENEYSSKSFKIMLSFQLHFKGLMRAN